MSQALRTMYQIIPMILVMGIIFFLSHQPGDSLSLPEAFNLDKVLHFLVYSVLGLATCFGIPRKIWLNRVAVVRVGVVIFCLLYGISDEVHQSFIPGRFPSWSDVLADTLGGLLAVLLYSGYIDKKKNTGARQAKTEAAGDEAGL